MLGIQTVRKKGKIGSVEELQKESSLELCLNEDRVNGET